MNWETLLWELDSDGIGVVTLNRPNAANAMNSTMLRELGELAQMVNADDKVRALVVTGAGRAFCAGFDLKQQAANRPNGNQEWERALINDFQATMVFWDLAIPTVAAVNGPALAGGFELMLGCDLTIASKNATFGEPELQFGAGIVTLLLPWFVGPKIAKEIIFTGMDSMDATRAYSLGLINAVTEVSEVLGDAKIVALRMARMDPMVMRLTKKAFQRTYELKGMGAALKAALDLDIIIEGQGSDVKTEFLRILRDQTLKDALQWRNERLKG